MNCVWIDLLLIWILLSLNNAFSPKICVAKETKDIDVKGFSMIAGSNEAKTMTEHISLDCKWKFTSTTWNSNQITSMMEKEMECFISLNTERDSGFTKQKNTVKDT